MSSSRSPSLSLPNGGMQRSISEIFDLERDPQAPFSLVQGYQEDANTIAHNAEEGRAAKTQYLIHVMPVVTHLWLSGSELLDLATEKLADASREARWRVPIGDSGMLDFYLGILPLCGDDKRNLKLQTIRLIGNACADVDNNRAKVLFRGALPCLITLIKDPFFSSIAVVACYNVCVDFEPAQKIASEKEVTHVVIHHLSEHHPIYEAEFLEHCCELLALMITQDAGIEYAPSDAGVSLLRLANTAGVDERLASFCNLLEVATLHFQHSKFQKALIDHGGMTTALDLITTHLESLERPKALTYKSPYSQRSYVPRNSKDKAVSQILAFSQLVTEISNLHEFPEALYQLDSHFGATLFHLLESSRPEFQHCACVLLGNIARSGALSEVLVHTHGVHQSVISILKSTRDTKVQIAVLSLLNTLASLSRNKAELGNAGLIEFLPTLWYAAQNVPVQNASIRLTRNLLVGTWDNVRRFYRRLSRDKDSPAHMRSNISLLLAVFNHTSNETTKIEISRLITTLCRVGVQRKPDDALKLEQNKKKFFLMHPELDKLLTFMITQHKSGIVRSEGWFTLALMASTPEGAECVSGVLSEDGGMQALVETLEGKSILDGQPTTGTPNWPQWIDQFMGEGWDLGGGNTHTPAPVEDSQTLKMARIDRKNARTILRVLVNSGLDTIDNVQLSMYEGLLVTGSP